MKKTLIFCAAIAAALTMAAQRANAQTYCLDLFPTYCDQVQVTVQGGIVFGLYDYTCDGITLEPVMGTGGFGGGSFAGPTPPFAPVAMWDVNVATRTIDFYQTDGVSILFSVPGNPVNITPGACNFALSGGGAALGQ